MDLTTLFLINIGIGLLIIGISIPLILEKIMPNKWYGFRTPKTLSDEKIWYQANKYSGKVSIAAGVSITLISILFLALHKGTVFLMGLSGKIIVIIWFFIIFIPIIMMMVLSMFYIKKL